MAKQIGWSQESNLLYQISQLLTRLTQVTAANGGSVGLTSVGLSVPSAFSLANNPLITNGTIAITGAGTISQYIDGTGALQTFPTIPSLTGYVPYTGATSNLNLGTYNLLTNNVFTGFTSITASGTQVVLTVNSAPEILVIGSGGQTIKLPDATTLQNGANYRFNNNQSSGAILVNNNSNTLVVSIPSGGYVDIVLLSNGIAAGSWDRHDLAPSNVSWSTNTFDYAGSFTNGTWNGSVIAINRGGTGSATQNFVDLTTAQTIAGDKTLTGVLRPTVTTNRQTANYTLVLTDRGKLVETNVATANNLTIPLDSAVAFPIGSEIEVAQYGAGQTTIVATGGVTIRSASGNLKIASQYVAVSLIKIGTNEWYCFGNLSA